MRTGARNDSAPTPTYRRLATRIFSFALIALIAAAAYVHIFAPEQHAELQLEMRTAKPTIVQVFFTNGETAFSEANSSSFGLAAGPDWRLVRLRMPSSGIQTLRLDPTILDVPVDVKTAILVSADGSRKSIDLKSFTPANQIDSYVANDDHWTVTPTKGSVDPFLTTTLDAATGDLAPASPWIRVAKVGVMWFLSILVWSIVFSRRRVDSILAMLSRHPVKVVIGTALLATLLSCGPVVFSGKSFLSPGNGVLSGGIVMLYDSLPTLPAESDVTVEDVHAADVGAMMWHHFPFSVLQERSVKRDREFPLWNRFSSAGESMLGQGQTMLGDPFNWLTWMVGASAGAYDAKFVALRAIFAMSLGLTILLLTRSVFPSALVAFAAAFLSYFVYRVNHPAIFSLCYSPVLLLAWVSLAYSRPKSLPWAFLFVIAGNWLMLNSGTAKEAYVSAGILDLVGIAVALRQCWNRQESRNLYRLAIVSALPLSALIGIVVWAPLFETIPLSWSAYMKPQVQQLPLIEVAGFVDNIYFLAVQSIYWPSINGLIALGALVEVLALVMLATRGSRSKFESLALATAAFVCVAFAYGIVPGSVLIEIPFIQSIYHVQNTFLTAAITPACILAGLGFSRIASFEPVDRARVSTLALVIFATIFPLDILSRSGVLQIDINVVLGYGIALVLSMYVLLTWLARPRSAKFKPLTLGLLVVALLVLLGRGAQWQDVRFERFVFNPQHRANLLAESSVVTAVRQASTEPIRVVSSGISVFSGYRAALGLEAIDGPEALQERPYRDLLEALDMPYVWAWRMDFTDATLLRHRGALDLLGVGFVFTSGVMNGPELTELASDGRLRAYRRAGAWPRAFFAGHVDTYGDLAQLSQKIQASTGPFVALADEVKQLDPAISALSTAPAVIVPAKDYRLTTNRTYFTIEAPAAGVIYLGEADEAGNFEVTINGKPTRYLTANGAFKAVPVPGPGTYRVMVRYWPKHLSLFIAMALVGLVAAVAVFFRLRRGVRSAR